MEDIIKLFEKSIGQWVAVYVMGAFPNVVGGKLVQVFPQCVAVDQEHVIAYVPLERILYITLPKNAE